MVSESLRCVYTLLPFNRRHCSNLLWSIILIIQHWVKFKEEWEKGKNKLNSQGIKFLFVNDSPTIISTGHKKSETVRFNPAGFLMFSAFAVRVCAYTLFFFSFYFSISFFFFFLTVQVLDSTRTLSKFRSMSHLTKWKASLALQTVIALVGNHTVLAFTFNWAILSSSLKRLVSATHETERKNRIMFLGRFWCYCCSFRIEHTMKFLR